MTASKLIATVINHKEHRSSRREFTHNPDTPPSSVQVGRAPSNDIHLDERFVSGRQAEIFFDDRSARLINLGTVNKLCVEDQQLDPGQSVEIRGLRSFHLGPLELLIEHLPADTAGPPTLDPNTTFAPAPDQRERASIRGETDTYGPPTLWPSPETMSVDFSKAHQCMLRLRPLCAKLQAARRAWADEFAAAQRELAGNRAALDLLRREFAEFAEFEPGSTVRGGSELFSQAELGLVARAADGFFEPRRGPTSQEEVEAFLARVVAVVRAFSTATIEVVDALRRQDAELGIKLDPATNPVLLMASPEELARHLLDIHAPPEARLEQLSEVFAAALAHQSGILRGALAAGRWVSERLSPEEVERSVTASWPTRAAATWHRYEELYHCVFGEGEQDWARTLGPRIAEAVAEGLARAGIASERTGEDSERSHG